MARERDLDRGREDPQADVSFAVGRIDEDRLRERHLAREQLKLSSGISRASVKTASWFPASGRSVKTSQTT